MTSEECKGMVARAEACVRDDLEAVTQAHRELAAAEKRLAGSRDLLSCVRRTLTLVRELEAMTEGAGA